MRAMVMAISQYNMKILYKCYKLPKHNCKDHSEDCHECLKCKYCKAEMSAADATRLLSHFSRSVF